MLGHVVRRVWNGPVEIDDVVPEREIIQHEAKKSGNRLGKDWHSLDEGNSFIRDSSDVKRSVFVENSLGDLIERKIWNRRIIIIIIFVPVNTWLPFHEIFDE